MTKYIVTMCFFVVFMQQITANSQAVDSSKKRVKIFTNVDLVSRHSWRGGLADETFSIEPMVEMTIGKFTFGAWAAGTVNGLYKELDLYVNFSPLKGLNLGIYDYYCPPEKLSDSKFRDFKTWHILDAIASYSFQEIPLKLTAATVVGGMDTDYSTYLEASYTQPISKNNSLMLLVAGTPHKGAYASKADLVNTELVLKHTFMLPKKVSMPIYGRLVYNPHKKKTYFIVGVSFSGTSLL